MKIENEDIIICRCMEISYKEIKQAIDRHDLKSLRAIKYRTTAGMGLCQGKTCSKIIYRLLSEETGIDLKNIPPDTPRPPIIPLKLGSLRHKE